MIAYSKTMSAVNPDHRMVTGKVKDFREALKNKGYKLTVPRQLILKVMAENEGRHFYINW
jgi:Fe2+ or Zn2+ uptake regulation protein